MLGRGNIFKEIVHVLNVILCIIRIRTGVSDTIRILVESIKRRKMAGRIATNLYAVSKALFEVI